jgi:hypothetical protein
MAYPIIPKGKTPLIGEIVKPARLVAPARMPDMGSMRSYYAPSGPSDDLFSGNLGRAILGTARRITSYDEEDSDGQASAGGTVKSRGRLFSKNKPPAVLQDPDGDPLDGVDRNTPEHKAKQAAYAAQQAPIKQKEMDAVGQEDFLNFARTLPGPQEPAPYQAPKGMGKPPRGSGTAPLRPKKATVAQEAEYDSARVWHGNNS